MENPEDNFFFKPYELNPNYNDKQLEEEDCDEDEGITINEQSSLKHSLLFVHQSVWQRQLLAKYGNSLSLGCHIQNNKICITFILPGCKNQC